MEKDSFLSLNLMRSHKKKWHFQTQNCPAFCLKILCWTVCFGLFTWTKRAFSISACGTAPRDWGIGIPSKRRRRKTALFFVYYILRITQMYYKPNLALSFPLSYGSLFSYRSHTLCRKLLIFFRLEKNFRKCHSYWKLFLFLSFLIFSAFLLRIFPWKRYKSKKALLCPSAAPWHLNISIPKQTSAGSRDILSPWPGKEGKLYAAIS